MKIKIVDINSSEYQSLALEIGSVFNSSDWLRVYDDRLKTYGIYNKGNDLIGMFNLYFDKRMILSHLTNSPYSPTIGLCFKNPSKNNAKAHSFDKSIYKVVVDFVENCKSHIVTLALPSSHRDMQTFVWADYKVIPNYTYRINLAVAKSDEEVTGGFSPERRNDIKKAVKDGVTVRLTYDYAVVKEMVKHTFDRKNESLSIKHIEDIFSKFSNESNSFAFIAYQNDRPIAASFIVYDKNTAYYLLGGYDPKYKHQGAGAYCVASAINHTRELGIGVFDFEGSMLPEVERFFRGFGGEMCTTYTINKAILPIELLLKFKDRTRF